MALPNASIQESGTSSGYAAAFSGVVANAAGFTIAGDNSIITPGDGSNHTVSVGESIIHANTNDSTATITLGDDVAAETGYVVIVKDIGGNAATNNITITAETDASHNIDGSNQDITLSTNFGEERFYTDGTNFWTW